MTPDETEALLADVERLAVVKYEPESVAYWNAMKERDHCFMSAAPALARVAREQAGEIERLRGIVNDFVKWFSPSCEKDLKVILNEARAFPYLAPPAAKETANGPR